jgi:hypothetical protein
MELESVVAEVARPEDKPDGKEGVFAELDNVE